MEDTFITMLVDRDDPCRPRSHPAKPGISANVAQLTATHHLFSVKDNYVALWQQFLSLTLTSAAVRYSYD
ncbi:MAG: hypothetical protein OSB00_13515 [Sphingomonas bacterium]|nr:hypothetical protein [Sphingomonas bacterium]